MMKGMKAMLAEHGSAGTTSCKRSRGRAGSPMGEGGAGGAPSPLGLNRVSVWERSSDVMCETGWAAGGRLEASATCWLPVPGSQGALVHMPSVSTAPEQQLAGSPNGGKVPRGAQSQAKLRKPVCLP